MNQTDEEVLRRQIFIRVMCLAFTGTGYCPGCQQRADVFSKRRGTPGQTKDRCLDCWKMER